MTQTMRATVATGYGSPEVLQLQEVKKPVPKDKEVLVKGDDCCRYHRGRHDEDR